MSHPEVRTLGWLISTLKWYEELRAENAMHADAVDYYSAEALSRIQNHQDLLRVSGDLSAAPGISRITLLCEELDIDPGLTAANVRKLRVRVCRAMPCPLDAANALSLDEVADVIEGGSARRPTRQPAPKSVNPFRALLNLARETSEAESARFASLFGKRREDRGDWGPRVQAREIELRAAVEACLRAADATGLGAGEVERLVSGLADAIRGILLWQRDAPCPSEDDRRRMEWSGFQHDPAGDYLSDHRARLGQVWESVANLAALADRWPARFGPTPAEVDLLTETAGDYVPGSEVSRIVFDLNNPPGAEPAGPDDVVEVPDPCDLARRPWLPILRDCLASIPELAEGLTEEKLRRWLWRNHRVPPTRDLTAEDLVSLLESGLAVPSQAATGKANTPTQAGKQKRGTTKGEASEKIVSALTAHHQYKDGGCLNTEPIGVNNLARQAEVARSSVSLFFEKEFKGHDKYRALCLRSASEVAAALKILNREYSPHLLYGDCPPAERDDEVE